VSNARASFVRRKLLADCHHPIQSRLHLLAAADTQIVLAIKRHDHESRQVFARTLQEFSFVARKVRDEDLDATYRDEEIMVVNISRHHQAPTDDGGEGGGETHNSATADDDVLTDGDDDDIDTIW
jgi:hypothetical protein